MPARQPTGTQGVCLAVYDKSAVAPIDWAGVDKALSDPNLANVHDVRLSVLSWVRTLKFCGWPHRRLLLAMVVAQGGMMME